MKTIYFLLLTALYVLLHSCKDDTTYKALIITGQNVHNWQASSPILKQILENTGMFKCEIATTPEKGGDMSTFAPDFSKYRLIVLDYAGDPWTDETKSKFVDYVKNGGGVVVYHFSCAAFPEWKEYNEMIGLGGWGERSEKDGPYMYYQRNQLVIDTSSGIAGSHGESREFMVRTRISDHPITRGLPSRWMHGKDELYSQLRGPGRNMQILATAFADTVPGGGTMRDEPMLMTINYGKGRIFSTVMGHADEGGGPAIQCAGFVVTLQRGAEWAATGDVTQAVPFDFPSGAGVVTRQDYKEMSLEDAIANLAGYEVNKSTRSLGCLQHHIRNAANNKEELLNIEKMMTKVLSGTEATVEAKKLILRELSWMGTDYSFEAIQHLSADKDLKDEADFAMARLNGGK